MHMSWPWQHEQLSHFAAAADAAADCKLESPPQRVNCTWANVAPGDTKVLQFNVTASEIRVVKNVATVSCPGATP